MSADPLTSSPQSFDYSRRHDHFGQIVGMGTASMTYSIPVIDAARSEARKATNSATSSNRRGRPRRDDVERFEAGPTDDETSS
jgi:hypothetical protein